MSSRTPDYQGGQAIPGTVYRVHRVIGAGGMGTVYDVEDTTVGKRYVLKTLHGDLHDRADLAARLAREARALAKLQHPNIVEVYTSGTTQDTLRLPYYVMERLQGQSLRTVLEKKGRLSVEQACDIGIDLLDALDHAHEYGIIHRDVKPDNIFITRGRDGRALAKLLDFGIIKLAGGVSAQTMATGGRFIGTFRYAPPEQILGRDVTPQSDLYAAGLVLYEMMAGRGPFDDFTGEMEIGKAHIDVPPPPLSRFANVNATTEQLVMSALQKDPALRPRDAFTFASALRDLKRQLAGGVPTSSRTHAATVEQVVAQPMSAARPATPFGGTHDVKSVDLVPPSSGPTRIDAPGGMHAATAAAAPMSPRTQTLSLGVNPLGLPPAQETFAAAPLQVAAGEAPIPLVQPAHVSGPVDRRAETREAAPQVAQRPNYDTAPIPLAVMARPDSVSQNNGTFGPHTTEASQRKKSARGALLALVSACAIGALAAVALLIAWKMHHTANTQKIGSPGAEQVTSVPKQGTAAPEQGTAAPEQGTAAPEQGTAAPEQATGAPKQATSAPEQATGVSVATTATTATTTAHVHTTQTQTQTYTPPPATTAAATATATQRHRVGSGL